MLEECRRKTHPAGKSEGPGWLGERRLMVTRQQRLNDFHSNGPPPAGEPMELLCEDHNGTYLRASFSLSVG